MARKNKPTAAAMPAADRSPDIRAEYDRAYRSSDAFAAVDALASDFNAVASELGAHGAELAFRILNRGKLGLVQRELLGLQRSLSAAEPMASDLALLLLMPRMTKKGKADRFKRVRAAASKAGIERSRESRKQKASGETALVRATRDKLRRMGFGERGLAKEVWKEHPTMPLSTIYRKIKDD